MNRAEVLSKVHWDMLYMSEEVFQSDWREGMLETLGEMRKVGMQKNAQQIGLAFGRLLNLMQDASGEAQKLFDKEMKNVY